MLIDTHTHLYLPDFVSEDCPDGSEKAVDRAKATGVGHLILPNVDFTTVEPMRRLHDLRPEMTSVAMGFHPTEVLSYYSACNAVTATVATISSTLHPRERSFKGLAKP